MPHTKKHHPIRKLNSSAQSLDEHTTRAARQAETGLHSVQRANANLANLDLDKVFSQLREMVAMVGGKSNNAPHNDSRRGIDESNVINFPANVNRAVAKAAE